jgi:histidinol-phosphatase
MALDSDSILTPAGSMDTRFADDLALAMRLADAASAISMAHFRQSPREWTKSDGSLVTEADLAVEHALRALLVRERPDDAILGEEAGASGAGSRRWIIDAIDGTVDFAKGTPHWCTLIALELDQQLAVAVCEQPSHRRRYWATRGGGAFRLSEGDSEPHRLRVSDVATVDGSRSTVSSDQWLPDDESRRSAAALRAVTRKVPVVEHPALQVASGGFEFVVFFMAGPWDVAAPALIVREAGGRFTDLDGRDALDSGNGVFSNGHLHDDVLRLVAR